MGFNKRRKRSRCLLTHRPKKESAAQEEENGQDELLSDPMDETTIHARHAPPIGRGETRQQDLLEEFIEEQENEKLFPSTQRNMIPLQLAIGYFYRFVLHAQDLTTGAAEMTPFLM